MERDMRMPGSELFCRLPGQGMVNSMADVRRRANCNCAMPDRRGSATPRKEVLPNDMTDDGGQCHLEGEIGNPYPCGENGVQGRSLAMVYAPLQAWQGLYDPATALCRGTLFRALDLPLVGGGPCGKGGMSRGC